MKLMQRYTHSMLLLSFAMFATNLSAGDIQLESCDDGRGSASSTPEDCSSKAGRCRVPRSRKGDRRKGDCDYCEASNGKNKRCTFRDRTQSLALDWTGPCSPIGSMAYRGCPTAQKIVWCCKTKAYPDSGWAPPAHVPINRTGGGYGNNWHNGAASGYGPGAPMVYMPTDTTQLGYSYRNAPTWQPNPGRIPSVPNPSNFHNRFCPQPGAHFCPGGNADYMQETMEMGSSCDMGYAQMMQPVPAMASVQSVRPSGAQPQPGPTAKPVVAKTVQVSATQSKNNVRPATNTVRRSTTQRPGQRTTPPAKQSNGWFGLPSLREALQ